MYLLCSLFTIQENELRLRDIEIIGFAKKANIGQELLTQTYCIEYNMYASNLSRIR